MKSFFLLAMTMMLGLGAQAQSFGIQDRDAWDRGGWDHPGWPGGREQTRVIVCQSEDRRPASCGVGGWIVNARVSRQLSNASCDPGNSWGYDRDYIWVQHGCRAEFVVTLRGGRPGRPDRPDRPDRPRPPRSESLRCASRNHRFANCDVRGFIDYVEVERQHSHAACVAGHSFGYNNSSIWVDRGCEATFRVYYR